MTPDRPSPDDESLLRGVRAGDHGAFALLVERYADLAYRVAYRQLGNREDAEDAVQAVLLKLWERPDAWDERRGTKFTTWLYRVIVNRCLDERTRRKPAPLADDFEITDARPGQDEQFDQQQRLTLIDRYIGELPERQRAALNLCFYVGLSNREAADVMRVNLKALQSLLMRAKAALKHKLETGTVRGVP